MTGVGRVSGSGDEILRVAALLFAERGYAGTSIRDVATMAGVSPAMVMKVGGNKEGLFRAVASFDRLDLSGIADADLAAELVRGVLDRDAAGDRESLTRAVALVMPAPSHDEVRERFGAALVAPLTERLGDPLRAQLVVSLLVGLAVSRRMLGQLDATVVDADELARRWTPLVQQVIDGD